MSVSIRLKAEEEMLIKQYAELHSMSISTFIRKTIMEKIEDEIDIKAYNEAMAEYKANLATYTLDEVKKELGL